MCRHAERVPRQNEKNSTPQEGHQVKMPYSIEIIYFVCEAIRYLYNIFCICSHDWQGM